MIFVCVQFFHIISRSSKAIEHRMSSFDSEFQAELESVLLILQNKPVLSENDENSMHTLWKMVKIDFKPLPIPQSKSDFDKKFSAYSPRGPVLAVKKSRPFQFPLWIWSWICKNIQVLKNLFFLSIFPF